MTEQQHSSPAIEEWTAWRQVREADLAAEFGWLTLTSFQWLPSRPARLDGLPGLWSTSGTTAALTTTADDGFVVVHPADDSEQTPGQQISGTITARLHNGESLMWVRSGTVLVEVAVRANRYAVRTRDSQAATRRNFHGVPTYDYAPEWVVPATFAPFGEPLIEKVASARDDVSIDVTAAGEVQFEYDSVTHRLAAAVGTDGGLTLNFHDRTNNATTAPWRFVRTGEPAADGSVTIDFNRTLNYPFSFTAYGACPAPMRANQLELAVEAGEKATQR